MRLAATLLLLFSAVAVIDARSSDGLIPVHGLVIDKDTREGIPDAVVTIFHEDHEISVCTDSSGYFIISSCRCASCVLSAYHHKYGRAQSTEMEINDNTPLIRIDLSRNNMRKLGERIRSLIEIADCTYVEQEKIAVSFEEEVRRLTNSYSILSGKMIHKRIARIDHGSLEGIIPEREDEMTKPSEISELRASETLSETYGRKTRDVRRLSHRIKASKKAEA